MMHEKDAVIQVATELSKKVIALQADCNAGKLDESEACYRLDDMAAMARMITADTFDGEYDNISSVGLTA